MYKGFEEMMNKLSPTMRRIAHRMNGHFTFFSDEDLYQEASTHMWGLFQKGLLDDKTDSYILQGCYFHLKNYLRKTLDKAKLVSLNEPIDDDGTTLADTIACGRNDAQEEAHDGMIAEGSLPEGLTEREIEIVRLSIEGLTVRDIAKRLGISHVMVVKIKKRIRRRCHMIRSVYGGDRYGKHGA